MALLHNEIYFISVFAELFCCYSCFQTSYYLIGLKVPWYKARSDKQYHYSYITCLLAAFDLLSF